MPAVTRRIRSRTRATLELSLRDAVPDEYLQARWPLQGSLATPPTGMIWQPGVLPTSPLIQAEGQFIRPAARRSCRPTSPPPAPPRPPSISGSARTTACQSVRPGVGHQSDVRGRRDEFPYIDGTASPGVAWTTMPSGTECRPLDPTSERRVGNPSTIYSAQRLQPIVAGTPVPMPNAGAGALNAQGHDEQHAPGHALRFYRPNRPSAGDFAVLPGAVRYQGTCGFASDGAGTGPASTNYIYTTRSGFPNDGENWDYFVFNDRDFSSVAELLLVPGCPPGLFRQQFAEFALVADECRQRLLHRWPTITPTSNNLAMKARRP